MMRLLLGLIVISGTFIFLGGRDLWLASKAGSEPEKLTARDLLARGANGNPYVEVSNFVLGDNLVYEEEHGRWTKVWVPFGAADDGDAGIVSVRAVMKSSKVKSESDLSLVMETPTVRGMIMNQIESLGRDEKRILSQSYAGTDAADILILEIGKDPAQMKKFGGTFFGIGVLGMLASGGIGFVIYRRSKT